MKKEKNYLFIMLLTITILLFAIILGSIVADILAGALNGEPETGWATAIAIFIYGPVFGVFGAASYLKATTLRSKGSDLKYNIKLAIILTTVIVFLFVIGMIFLT